jgi:hypothetical protein
MLTLSNARPEANTSLLGHLGENLSLACGLFLWAVAVLCIASLGPACASLVDGACCIAAVGGGVL